jgi:hypothetical protein
LSAYALFVGGPRRGWWDVFTDEHCRHVAAIWFDEAIYRWIVLDYVSHGVTVQTFAPAEYSQWLIGQMSGSAATLIKADRKASRAMAGRFGLWCVPLTAHAVGSKSRAWRPRALMGDLLREGGRVIATTDPRISHDQPESPPRI